MPPVERPLPMYIAEPPQEALPYGRWAEALGERFLEACKAVEADDDLGEPGEVAWFPDRTWSGRTYMPASTITSNGFEIFGFVSFTREHQGAEALNFESWADYTDETAEANPDWDLDLRDHTIGAWRGRDGRTGEVTMVWGDALVTGGAVATAELGPSTTDQCVLAENRFTLISLDAFTGDYIEVRLFADRGRELAVESLYEDE